MAANIDVTKLVDELIPGTWECPHCGSWNTTGEQANDILCNSFKYLEHCPKCGYVHCWKLELTDEFYVGVVNMINGWLKEDMEKRHVRETDEG